ncbi:MAG: hypothetical protein ABIV43_03455 [Candidatus Saccharimonadales bacterium]
MSPALIITAIVITPVVLLMLLRVNAALVFLSLCLGAVLTRFLGPDVNDLLSLLSSHSSTTITASQTTAQLVLLAIPVVLTIVFMVRSVPKGFKLVLNAVPSVGVGLLALLLVVPLLPPEAQRSIVSTDLWSQVLQLQDLLVGSSALLCLFALLSLRPKTGHEKHAKKHKA